MFRGDRSGWVYVPPARRGGAGVRRALAAALGAALAAACAAPVREAGEESAGAVEVAQVRRAHGDFRRIDAHEHFRAGASIEPYLAVARTLGIEQSIFVPTGLGPDNRGYRENMAALLAVQRRYPDRIVAFATLDEADPHAAEVLEQAVADGARGLKLIGGHPHFYDEPLDSANMRRVYEVARRHHLPVLVHASLTRLPVLRGQLPELTIIAAHYIETAPQLAEADELLAEHPNLLTYLAMGGGLQRNEKIMTADPQAFRDFIVRHQDRILWGADVILKAETTDAFLRHRITKDLDILEQARYVDPDLAPGEVRPGLALPRAVLEKIYWENPRRVLAAAPPARLGVEPRTSRSWRTPADPKRQ
ncbi:MAG: amidohydrolase family protein [Proteobacteria bacterium]|nr:amidohydrolase family protein [Pseudomonadota bacterium]